MVSTGNNISHTADSRPKRHHKAHSKKQKARHVEAITHVLVFKYRHELLPSTPPVSYHTVQFVVTLGHCSAPNKPLSQPTVQAVQLASSELPA